MLVVIDTNSDGRRTGRILTLVLPNEDKACFSADLAIERHYPIPTDAIRRDDQFCIDLN